MKITIEYGQTRRQIEGPFNICGSPEDLQLIVDCLADNLRLNTVNSYGWAQVAIRQKCVASTKAVPWDEAAEATPKKGAMCPPGGMD